MVIDPANITQVNQQAKSEQEATPDAVKEKNINNQGIPEAGQTSDVGPAVAVNISATALETSRAINAPEQTAQQSKNSDIIEAQEKDQLVNNATDPLSLPEKRIDTTV